MTIVRLLSTVLGANVRAVLAMATANNIANDTIRIPIRPQNVVANSLKRKHASCQVAHRVLFCHVILIQSLLFSSPPLSSALFFFFITYCMLMLETSVIIFIKRFFTIQRKNPRNPFFPALSCNPDSFSA